MCIYACVHAYVHVGPGYNDSALNNITSCCIRMNFVLGEDAPCCVIATYLCNSESTPCKTTTRNIKPNRANTPCRRYWVVSCDSRLHSGTCCFMPILAATACFTIPLGNCGTDGSMTPLAGL